MKLRVEPQGLHYYCRRSGTHVLLDEIETRETAYSKGPRTVSIAITDECDFTCSYCYVNLKDRYLLTEDILKYCKELDSLGTFDIAFGGGEPTLHPDLVRICQSIWKETKLGISITTHGHHLTEDLVLKLKDNISFLRISIDGVEPIYSTLRKKPLTDLLPKLRLLKNNIPFGINAVMNKLTIPHLDELKKLFIEYEAFELLLLPMWNKGKYVLTNKEWDTLNEWILVNHKEIPIRISSEAKGFLKLPYLFDNAEWDNDYGFIGIDKTFRKNSFTKDGLKIENYERLEELLIDWKNDSAFK